MAQNIFINIDPSGAQTGASRTVQALNSIVNASQQVNIQITNMNNRVDRASSNISSKLDSIYRGFRSLKLIIGTLVPLGLFESLISKIISVDKSYQAFSASMFAATNDTKEAAKAFEFVSKVARTYGVDLENISKSYAKFRAATATLIPTAAVDKLFIALTEVSSVLHMSPENVNRMFTAFTQMASKGQIYAEELKQQLGEHLPGTMALAAQAMGMTVRELMDTMKKGQVDIKKFFMNMPDVIHEKFSGAAKIASQSISAQVNNLKSTIYKNFVELNSSGATVGISKLIQSIDNLLQPTNEKFKALGQVIGETALKLSVFIDNLSAEDVSKFAEQLIIVIKAYADLAIGIGLAIAWSVKHAEELMLLAKVLAIAYVAQKSYNIITAASVGASALAAKGLLLLRGAMLLVASFIAGWQLGTYLKNKYLEVELFGIAMARGLHITIVTFIEGIKVLFTAAFTALKLAAQKTSNLAASAGNSIAEFFGLSTRFEPLRLYDEKLDMGALDVAVKQFKATRFEVNTSYTSSADEAIERKIKANDANLAAEVAKHKDGLDQYSKLMAEYEQLKKEAEDMFADPKYSAFGDSIKKDSEAKSKAVRQQAKDTKELVALIKENASNLKNAYDGSIKLLQQDKEEGLVTDKMVYENSMSLLRNYTNDVIAEYKRGLAAEGLTEKDRADLQGRIAEARLTEYREMLRLKADFKKSEEQYYDDIYNLEVSVGSARVDEVRNFVIRWNKEYAKLANTAEMDGDKDSLDRINKAKAYGEALAKLQVNDDVGANEFKIAEEAMKRYGDVLKNTEFEVISLMGAYETLFEKLRFLQDTGVVSAIQATEIHNRLMMQRKNALEELRIKMLELNLELGNATWADTLELGLRKMQEGFVNFSTSFKQMTLDVTNDLTSGIGSAFSSIIKGTDSVEGAFAKIGETIIDTVINALVQMGIQWLAQQAMMKMTSSTMQAATVTEAAATGKAVTAAYTPAAAVASVASFGKAPISASMGMLAFGAVMAAVIGGLIAGAFDNGGYIPEGKLGIVGEYGPELISGPVAVTGRKTTEDLLSGSRKESENRANAAAAQTNNVEVKNDNRLNIYNVLSPEVVISALRSPIGEKAVLNVIDRNRTKVNI